MRTDWDDLRTQIIACRKCDRLVSWREQVASERKRAFQDCVYWGKPVVGFGDPDARVLVVGMAPGAHGSNRTGRMFTGDSSGNFLYAALHRMGFANQPTSVGMDDDLALEDLFISSVCRCVPPQNKPVTAEMNNCLPFLEQEYQNLPNLRGVVVLGGFALMGIQQLFRHLGISSPRFEFAHLNIYPAMDRMPWVITSYHPSRQNTQTGRLTVAMFDSVWQAVQDKLTKSH